MLVGLQEGSKAVRQLGGAVENRQSFRGVGGHLTRATKALVVSKPIAIFYPRDGKS